MAKYNVVKKVKRAAIQQRKRVLRGDPSTGKLRHKQETAPLSGKRKRKLFKKWRREQKEALKKGLVSMEDVEMAVAEGTSQVTTSKAEMKFPLKKSKRLKIKKLKGKGINRKTHMKNVVKAAPVDAMQE